MGTFTPPLHDRARSASGISAGNARSRCCARQFNAFDQEFAKAKSARISAEIRRGKAAAWTFPGLRPPTAKSPNMKRLALILLIGGTALPSAFAWQNSRNSSLLARVTVYWARGGHGADRYTRQHRSATGMKLHVGHCAVDPKKIPYGSRVVLPDGTTLSAVDTGSAVRNRKAARRAGRNPNERNAVVIDKFFETKQQALAWANSNPPFVNVKVIPPNMPAVTKPNLTNNQPIALTQPQPANKTGTGGPVGTTVVASNAPPAVGPAGGVVRNPLGRMGR